MAMKETDLIWWTQTILIMCIMIIVIARTQSWWGAVVTGLGIIALTWASESAERRIRRARRAERRAQARRDQR